jgi:hypothetical protein
MNLRTVQQENMELKQQLELMKMCGKVNKNPTLKQQSKLQIVSFQMFWYSYSR